MINDFEFFFVYHVDSDMHSILCDLSLYSHYLLALKCIKTCNEKLYFETHLKYGYPGDKNVIKPNCSPRRVITFLATLTVILIPVDTSIGVIGPL